MNGGPVVVAALVALLAGCGDPDTRPTPENTFEVAGHRTTMVNASSKRPLSPPRYLPDWAVVYPGAKLEHKSVQWNGRKAVRRGTGYSTTAPYPDVVRFYDDQYRSGGATPVQVSAGRNGKTYDFGPGRDANFVALEVVGTLPDAGALTRITVVQTPSR